MTDYTVLNRIVPTDRDARDRAQRHVLSTLAGRSTTGGRIWFYSPGGIVVGATAVFDVGSLLLTTDRPSNWSTTANGFSATLRQGDGQTSTSPESKIVITRARKSTRSSRTATSR